MKKLLFLMTHLGSKWEDLAMILKTSLKIDDSRSDCVFYHLDDLRKINEKPHKNDNANAIWLVPILHNIQINRMMILALRNAHKFIFFANHMNLEEIMKNGYTRQNAEAYFHSRLNGMNSYHKLIPNAPWINYYDAEVIEDYLREWDVRLPAQTTGKNNIIR
jgi:hypothetical protein